MYIYVISIKETTKSAYNVNMIGMCQKE